MTRYPVTKRQEGFSLVELSIVLVILGLLVGGVLGGKSLIRAAELRAVGEEYQQVEHAVLMFRDTYQQLPGDMNEATAYWTGTANGNGDGIFQYASSANNFGEIFTFWQQLALAGLLPGQYTGQAGSGSIEDSQVDVNVMRTAFPGGGWGVFTIRDGFASDVAGNGWYNRNYGHVLQIGRKITDWEYGGALFVPADAFFIDNKVDDGIPGTGKVIGRFWNNQCATARTGATTSTNLDTQYRLTDSQTRCALMFLPAFNYQ